MKGFNYLLWLTGTLALTILYSEAIKIDCDNPNQVNEDHIHFCCKHPDGHNDLVDLCSKESGFKMPSPKEESIVDLTADRAIAGTCFGKCIFQKLNFLKNDTLDMNMVRKYYNEQHKNDPEYAKEMINAFDHCHGKVEDNAAKFLSNPIFKEMSKTFCEPRASVTLACVIRQFFHNCPPQRSSSSEECKTVLAYSKGCENALASM